MFKSVDSLSKIIEEEKETNQEYNFEENIFHFPQNFMSKKSSENSNIGNNLNLQVGTTYVAIERLQEFIQNLQISENPDSDFSSIETSSINSKQETALTEESKTFNEDFVVSNNLSNFQQDSDSIFTLGSKSSFKSLPDTGGVKINRYTYTLFSKSSKIFNEGDLKNDVFK